MQFEFSESCSLNNKCNNDILILIAPYSSHVKVLSFDRTQNSASSPSSPPNPMPSTPTLTTGLTPSIISRYSAFILDQYGVLHDGATPLPGAVDAIKRLKSQNKKLAILSNTSASSASCLERLYGKLSFPPKSFDVAVTRFVTLA